MKLAKRAGRVCTVAVLAAALLAAGRGASAQQNVPLRSVYLPSVAHSCGAQFLEYRQLVPPGGLYGMFRSTGCGKATWRARFYTSDDWTVRWTELRDTDDYPAVRLPAIEVDDNGVIRWNLMLEMTGMGHWFEVGGTQ